MNRLSWNRVVRLIAPFLILSASQGLCVDRYWDNGSADGQWGTPTNWRQFGVNDNVLPQAGDRVILDKNFVGGNYTVTVNVVPPVLNQILMDTRAAGATTGNVRLAVNNNMVMTDLILTPSAGRTIDIRNTTDGIRFRVDNSIQIGLVAGGGTANFATFNASNDLYWDFDLGARPATISVANGTTVNFRLTAGGAADDVDAVFLQPTDDVTISWLSVATGNFEVQVQNCTIGGLAGALDHYLRLEASDPAFPNRALVLGVGTSGTLTNTGDDIANLAIQNDGSVCTFGDGDGAGAETVTLSGTGDFVMFGDSTFQSVTGFPADRLTMSCSFWLQQDSAAQGVTTVNGFSTTFSGGTFQHYFGSMTFGTSAANNGAISISGTSRGFTRLFIPLDPTTVDVTHSMTINGAGTLTISSGVDTYGNGYGGGGQGRIVANDTATLALTAAAPSLNCYGGTDSAPANPGELQLNGSSVANVSNGITLISDTESGGALTVNGSATCAITGNLAVNVSATANHDGGRVNINGTGRVSVSGTLTVQGSNSAGTTGGKVTVNSARTVPNEALAVTGATSLNAGVVSAGTIEFGATSDCTTLFTGAVTVNDNGGAAPDAALTILDTSAPGPTIALGNNLTVNGTFNPNAGVGPGNARSTMNFNGAVRSIIGTSAIVVDTATFNGTYTLDAGSGGVDLTAHESLRIAPGGSLTCGGANNITIDSATWDNDATFTIGADTTQTVFFAGTSTYSGTTSTTFRNLTVSSGTTTASVGDNVGATINRTLTVSGGATLDLGVGDFTLNGAFTHTITGGLAMNGAAADRPRLLFTAGAIVNLNGSLTTTSVNLANRPAITSSAGQNTNLRLDGATIDIRGLFFSNGVANGLLITNAGGTEPSVLEFRNVDFSTMATPGGRHMTVRGAGGFKMVGVGCTFSALAAASDANIQVDKNGGAGDAMVTMVGVPAALNGWGQELALPDEGGPDGGGTIRDDDAPGGPSGGGPTADGYCEWVEGGDFLTRSPGTGEDRTVGHSEGVAAGVHTGVQGFVTPHYDWYTGDFVSSYALVRTTADNDGFDGLDDMVVALNVTGSRKYTYSVNRGGATNYGRVIGPAWTVTIDAGNNEPNADADPDLVCFVTTEGYIFVLQDNGASLAPYGPYPLRAKTGVGADNITKAYSPLMFYTGLDFHADDPTLPPPPAADLDRFIFCGANGVTNQVYVVKAFESTQEARAVAGFPAAYSGPPSRSWPAFQFFPGGTLYLHIGTDSDLSDDGAVPGPPAAGTKGHLFRINMASGAIDAEYPGDLGGPPPAPGTVPGNHVRGGIQMLDDPAFDSDAELYFGCFEDAVAGNDPSFFSIATDTAAPAGYVNRWAPANLGTGDVDMYATFDSGQIYLGDSAGDLYALVRTTGLAPAGWATWPRPLDAGAPAADRAIRSSPVSYVNRRGAGELYVGNDNGKVFQIDPANGNILRTWRLGDGRKVRSISIVDDYVGPPPTTYIVVITSDGYVFLIKVS